MIGQSQPGHGQGQIQGQIISQSEAEFMSMETTYTTTRAAAAAGSGGQRAGARGSRAPLTRAVGENQDFLVWVRIPVGVEKNVLCFLVLEARQIFSGRGE